MNRLLFILLLTHCARVPDEGLPCGDDDACTLGFWCDEGRCTQGERPLGMDGAVADAEWPGSDGQAPEHDSEAPLDLSALDMEGTVKDMARADMLRPDWAMDGAPPDMVPDNAVPEAGLEEPEVGLPPPPMTALIAAGPYRQQDGTEAEVAGFYIDLHEVTVAAYTECVTNGDCPERQDPRQDCTMLAQHPVNCVPIAAAWDYCVARGGFLPAEVQWEKAARGGCERRGTPACEAGADEPRYPWDEDEPECQRHAQYNACAGLTTPINSHPDGHSTYGVFDLAGNLAEWTRDCFDASINPEGQPRLPACPQFVVRGGHFDSPALSLVTTFREGLIPEAKVEVGFRCVYPLEWRNP